MSSIYIISEIQLSPVENSIHQAIVSKVIRYAETEQEAKEFCDKGKVYTQEDCWGIRGSVNQYSFKEIKNTINE